MGPLMEWVQLRRGWWGAGVTLPTMVLSKGGDSPAVHERGSVVPTPGLSPSLWQWGHSWWAAGGVAGSSSQGGRGLHLKGAGLDRLSGPLGHVKQRHWGCVG